MQAINDNEHSLQDLPPELTALVASGVEPGDLVRFCAANSGLLSACRANVVDWRMEAPEIEAVLPPRMSARRFLSPLDVAWYVSAVDAFRRKCTLYAVMLVVNNALAFADFMGSIPTPSGRRLAGIPDAGEVDTEPHRRDHMSFISNLSDMEAWARRQPRLVGFYFNHHQLMGDAPIEVVGPLGPHAAFVSDPPALFAVLDDADTIGWGGVLSAAQNQAFVAQTQRRINRTLTKALGPYADRRTELAILMNRATAIDRETPDTRGTQRPIDVRTKVAAFCDDIDLWRAYPDAEVYLVKADGEWTAGVALPF
ncbi:hypothetical protein psal_cds_981 [Pandoravirus salinus]|uniref:DUF5902 domain-containing protein n=1 Tax=Pandoravirus salinus TaxID=1349410 RepID=S4W3D4_9VIRU|nr:hypothetical protein psal_cds_981 [Pandoravirus salinus]AGO85142.1 hypothetical protein psal_cds_981 [Pandoravirus salinus]